MSIGARRHTVTLQQPSRAANGAGGATVSWADVATLKASVRWDGRDDAVSGGRVDAGRVGSVVLRYRGAVNTTMRLVFDSRYLYIIRGPGQQESRQSGEQHVRVEERAT